MDNILKREQSTSVSMEGSCNKMAKSTDAFNKKAKSTRLKKGIKEVFTSL